jgi:hypothetical protein
LRLVSELHLLIDPPASRCRREVMKIEANILIHYVYYCFNFSTSSITVLKYQLP